MCLHYIFKYPNITRLELAEKLNVNKSIMTRTIKMLHDDRWIEKATIGAKNIPLNLNKSRFIAAGVEIQPEYQYLTICNLEGEIISEKKWNKPIDNIITFIEDDLQVFLESNQIKVDTIGIALPGVIHKEKNNLLCSQPFNISYELDLPKETKKGQRLYYENDARCTGWGLVSFNKEYSDFFLLQALFMDYPDPQEEYQRISIGVSIFTMGKAFYGSNSCSGEFRSIFQVEDGPQGQSVIAHKDRIKMKHNSAILQNLLEELSIHTGFIANLIDVKKIFIAGSLIDYKAKIERLLTKHIARTSLYPHLQKHFIEYICMKESSIARGAAGMAINRVLKEPTIKEENPFYESIVSRASLV